MKAEEIVGAYKVEGWKIVGDFIPNSNYKGITMDDKYDVFCIINNNIVNAEIRLYDEEKCKIELVIGDDILSAEDDNYFYALNSI